MSLLVDGVTLHFCLKKIKCLLGYAEYDNPNSTEDQYLNDFKRIDYMAGHLNAILKAIRYKH